MESVGRYCFYHQNGKCYFVRNDPTECNICPNFLSFRKEALSYCNSDKLPIDYFDLNINKGNRDSLQQTLIRF